MEKEINVFLKNQEASNSTLADRLKQIFWIEKLSNTTGLIFLLSVSLIIGALIAYKGILAGAVILALMFGPPIVYAIVAFPLFGISILLIMAYLLFFIMRQGVNFPMGTLMDGIQAMLILGFFIHQKRRPDWSVFRGQVSLMILIWVSFNIIEVANPAAESRLAWLYTIRSVAVVMLMYFVFIYHINTIKAIKAVVKIWISLSIFAALYAYKQEYIGFSDVENAWLNSDPNITGLLFIGGHWRKFSIFSDPVAFSYNMVVSSLLCIALLTNARSVWKIIVLSLLIALFFTAMLFSGTRGAYVLLPATMILFLILKLSKQVVVGSAVAGLFILFLIFVPTSNPNLVRFQTAFTPSNDESFKVRTANQKRIQPYIWTHPIGGGLGATGAWGSRFAPNSYLASFPPDSGYVRIAVELGWIGLFIFCVLIFFILKEGINNYFTIQNPELKMYCLAMLLIIFAYNIGNYPQEALVQLPSNIYFYLATALITITKRVDDKEISLKLRAGS